MAIPDSSWYISQTFCTTNRVSRGDARRWCALKLTRAALKSAMCLAFVSFTPARANRSSLSCSQFRSLCRCFTSCWSAAKEALSMEFVINLPVKSSSSGGRRNLPKTVAEMTAIVTNLLGLDVSSVLSAGVPQLGNKCSHCQTSWQALCSVLLACCTSTCCHFPAILTTTDRSIILVFWHSSSRKCSSSGTLTWRTPSSDHSVLLCWSGRVGVGRQQRPLLRSGCPQHQNRRKKKKLSGALVGKRIY